MLSERSHDSPLRSLANNASPRMFDFKPEAVVVFTFFVQSVYDYSTQLGHNSQIVCTVHRDAAAV